MPRGGGRGSLGRMGGARLRASLPTTRVHAGTTTDGGRRTTGVALRRRPASPPPGDPPHPGRFPKRPYREGELAPVRCRGGSGTARGSPSDAEGRGAGKSGADGRGASQGLVADNARPRRHDDGRRAAHDRRRATPTPRTPSPRRPTPPRALPEAPLQGGGNSRRCVVGAVREPPAARPAMPRGGGRGSLGRMGGGPLRPRANQVRSTPSRVVAADRRSAPPCRPRPVVDSGNLALAGP